MLDQYGLKEIAQIQNTLTPSPSLPSARYLMSMNSKLGLGRVPRIFGDLSVEAGAIVALVGALVGARSCGRSRLVLLGLAYSAGENSASPPCRIVAPLGNS